MKYKIVVARFNEDIEWLKPVISDCIIYNKGGAVGLPNEISIPNVGRESDTYLRYIIDNYDTLPDLVAFTQGRISDHRRGDGVEYLLTLLANAAEFDISLPNVIHDYTVNTGSNIYWGPEWNTPGQIENDWFLTNNYFENNHIPFCDFFKKHIQPTYPNPIKIFSNALFAVKKELILNHPKSYYEHLLLYVNYHNNPVEAHFFERSWYYIFAK